MVNRSRSLFFALILGTFLVPTAVACSADVVTSPFDPVPTASATDSSTAKPAPTTTTPPSSTATTPAADAAPPPDAAPAPPKLSIAASYATSATQTGRYGFAIAVTNTGGPSSGFSRLAFDFGGKKISASAPCSGFPQDANSKRTIQLTVSQSGNGDASYSVNCPSGSLAIGNFTGGAIPVAFEDPVTVTVSGKYPSGETFETTTTATKQ